MGVGFKQSRAWVPVLLSATVCLYCVTQPVSGHNCSDFPYRHLFLECVFNWVGMAKRNACLVQFQPRTDQTTLLPGILSSTDQTIPVRRTSTNHLGSVLNFVCLSCMCLLQGKTCRLRDFPTRSHKTNCIEIVTKWTTKDYDWFQCHNATDEFKQIMTISVVVNKEIDFVTGLNKMI